MKEIAKVIACLGCFLVISGCVSGLPETITAPVNTVTEFSQPSQLVTGEPTIEATQTSKSTLIATPYFTRTATLEVTDIPTLNSSDARQALNTMISQNGGCKLPCWWGIYPGETRWVDARAVLLTFVERIDEQAVTSQGMDGIEHTITLAYVYFNRGFPSPEFSLEAPGYFSIQSVDGVVNLVLAYQDTASRFNLSYLLSEYGQPSEVYLNTTNASPTGRVPFSLVVYYEEKGILAFYHDNASVLDDEIRFCVENNSPINLETWFPSPTTSPKIKEDFITSLDYWIYDTGLQPIQTVTNLTIEQFYLNFRGSKNTSCIVTPSARWAITGP